MQYIRVISLCNNDERMKLNSTKLIHSCSKNNYVDVLHFKTMTDTKSYEFI